jgi:hypothetical protein
MVYILESRSWDHQAFGGRCTTMHIENSLWMLVHNCCSLIMVKHIKNQARIDKGDQCISSRLITLITMTLEL